MEKHMIILSATFALSLCAAIEQKDQKQNAENINITQLKNNSDKDMYVIHATVYEVGILTNSSGSGTENSTQTGTQEAVTFYRKNGSNVDLTEIPEPLLTNLTGQTLVGLAPVVRKPRNARQYDDSAAQDDAVLNDDMFYSGSEEFNERRIRQAHQESDDFQQDGSSEDSNEQFANEQLDSPRETYAPWFVRPKVAKGSGSGEDTRMVQASSMIPAEAGVTSVSLPPMASLNSALTTIPVPIPNTSVVHYSKISASVLPANKSKNY